MPVVKLRKMIGGLIAALVLGLPVAPAAAAPSLPMAPAKPLAGKTIVVDPGHNGLYKKSFNTKRVSMGGGKKACNTSGTAGKGCPSTRTTGLRRSCSRRNWRSAGRPCC